LALFFYNLFLIVLFPLILLRVAFRAIKTPDYRDRIGQRFGIFSGESNDTRTIWLHAVSVGEVVAAAPQIRTLLQDYPSQPLLVTTMTRTGYRQLQKLFPENVKHVYLPYDFRWAVKRFLTCFQPSIAIIMETEIWPNLYIECAKREIPVILVNARLSERSAKSYRRFSNLTHQVLSAIDHIAAQHQSDAERFIELGLKPERVSVTGSIKFDLDLPADLQEQATQLRSSLGVHRPVWIAASTHEGEDEIILQVHQNLLKLYPQTLLVLVPRHPERFDRVAQLCRTLNLQVVRRQLSEDCQPSTQVYLGDTMGELLLLYGSADIAFVGGSLVAVGGHNPLEPAALGLPILCGPHIFNFEDITQRLIAEHACTQVQNHQQLYTEIQRLIEDPSLRQSMGRKASHFVDANRGSLEKINTIVKSYLA
jgi:3-deoxy-D-manno-octulosonic-acid transferase